MSRNLIAILRGVRPDEVIGITEAILDAGIRSIEVPLNSPDPFDSIAKLAAQFGASAEIGAGTVLTVEDVRHLAEIGAGMVVSPNCDIEVIAETKALGMKSYPGVLTPSECFSALRAGADGLKIFPASIAGTKGISALRSVLPKDTMIYAVGGVDSDSLTEWIDAGVSGFGIGSSLYKAGRTVPEVAEAATAIVKSYDAVMAGRS